MRVNIILRNPSSAGKFASTKLSFTDRTNNIREVILKIDYESLDDFCNDTTSIAFDFFFVSAIVYGVDNLLDRNEYSIDAWARDIEVCFPVNNIEQWDNARGNFEQVLTFLTGDYWSISFSQINGADLFIPKANRSSSRVPNYHKDAYTFVSLFSGGLDSLVGVIDKLEGLNQNEKGLLISHFDSTSPGANKDQERIDAYLSQPQNYQNKFDWLQTIVYLSTSDISGNKISKESSYRSRSLLFIGIALYCVEKMPNCNTLTIPENGTISLNYPLTPSRTSTLSTRTTHPYYIEILQQFINSIGLTTLLNNPYKNMTKGELVERCTNRNMLSGIYEQSVSCGKRGRKQHWDNKRGTSHCGVCMPCIYRRAALHKLGLDNQLYGIDIFTTPTPTLEIQDMPALFDFLNRRLTTEEIKRTLLVSGSIQMVDLEDSARMVERVRLEIRTWITEKGSS